MRSLAAAAALLAGVTSLDALVPVAIAAGFAPPALPLDDDTRVQLGLGDATSDARLLHGEGSLRALLIECAPRVTLRDAVVAVAGQLTRRAPHPLWLLFAYRPASTQVAIAAWSGEQSRPRVAALLADGAHLTASDAETLAALTDLPVATDVLTHARWLELLGREALTRRFYRALERVVATLSAATAAALPVAVAHECALLYVSRLLFLSFLEAKGWLDGERRFLEQGFATCMLHGGAYHRRVLRPLFFGTLNTSPAARAPAARAFGRIPFLNGGLFARTPTERRWRNLEFSDDALGLVFGELLTRYRFTPREETARWSEAAIDPEMLGRAFESLMASGPRRASGAFFTPQPLVASVTGAALAQALRSPCSGIDAVAAALAGQTIDAPAAQALGARLAAIRLLDPACGSGAFLVHALEELAALAIRLGDPRSVSDVRRELLTRSIFGVDINPMAVWLCEMRLWLSVVIESDQPDPMAVAPLPNLDRHVRVGDALAGDAFGDALPLSGGAVLACVRQRYARASGARKHTLRRALERAERAFALTHLAHQLAVSAVRRRDLLSAARSRDLFGARANITRLQRAALTDERRRTRELRASLRAVREGAALPFAWATHFPEGANAGGFDVVLGNPPWVRLHRIPAALRDTLRSRYAVYRGAAWQRGAIAARAGTGFAAQVDLAALFVERGVALLRDGGTLALLLPAKLWRSLAGGGTRRLLTTTTHLRLLEDWSSSPSAFDAAVYPAVVVATRGREPQPAPLRAAVHGPSRSLHWDIPPARLALDDDPASPWLVLPTDVRRAFDRLQHAGIALGESAFGPPLLGVKCGCNAAFVVMPAAGEHDAVVPVHNAERSGAVERELLRPLLRGETLRRWRATVGERIIWTHGPDQAPLERLPPHAARWFAGWRRALQSRSDARGPSRWWAVFRVPSASSTHPRVVWADIGRTPRALVLEAGNETVALNSCYVLVMPDMRSAHAFAALLNSPVAAAWLHTLAEPARGRFHRYLGWTLALLPIPSDWERACALLVPLGERGAHGAPPSDVELLTAAAGAYGVRPAALAPLLAWSAE